MLNQSVQIPQMSFPEVLGYTGAKYVCANFSNSASDIFGAKPKTSQIPLPTFLVLNLSLGVYYSRVGVMAGCPEHPMANREET